MSVSVQDVKVMYCRFVTMLLIDISQGSLYDRNIIDDIWNKTFYSTSTFEKFHINFINFILITHENKEGPYKK